MDCSAAGFDNRKTRQVQNNALGKGLKVSMFLFAHILLLTCDCTIFYPANINTTSLRTSFTHTHTHTHTQTPQPPTPTHTHNTHTRFYTCGSTTCPANIITAILLTIHTQHTHIHTKFFTCSSTICPANIRRASSVPETLDCVRMHECLV